jgi:hypothetical protein
MNGYYCILTILGAGLIGFAVGYSVKKTELESNIQRLKQHISLYDV